MTVDPFDIATAPVGEPLGIVAGASSQWRRDIDIDESTFTLQYTMRRFDPATTPDGDDLSAQLIPTQHIDGSQWGVDLVEADTAGWASGRFAWDLIVTRISDGRTKTIDTGEINVFGTDTDRRSHAQIMVTKIESILQGRADNDVETYSIKSRSITKMSASDLRMWRDYYLRELQSQQPVDAGIFAAREPNRTTLRVRFRD